MHRFGAVTGALATAALLAFPAPARADSSLTVRVEFYYGAAVAGGVGIFIWVSGAWEMAFGERAPATALLELERGRVRPGIPLPVARPDPAPGAEGMSGGVAVDLVRVRF